MNAIMKNDKQTVWINGLYLIGLAIIGIIGGIVNTIYAARVALGVANGCVQTNMLRFRVWRTRMLKSFRHRTWLFE